MLSYGLITFHFRVSVFTHTRWLLSYCCVSLPDACRNMFLLGLLVSAWCALSTELRIGMKFHKPHNFSEW